ncbi:type II toxin-antitoxin system antitoxin SocA domain-containing protein [Halopenitus sp. POP-27]|uniref:type II toxin-antitoxin system antitoxin SocA domain-containing protein n=1 Tax=Halopenitus sp. POP-27 TaxID=2994425 RepID=UPI00246825F7|nr:type II toxin-antitoxin system antitoxin SocA domain-containing protein [Halopenitus sp. POP-27]
MPIEYNLSEEDVHELKEVIREFLSKYKYLFEIRIQKLVYYTELYSIENYGVRITKANFKPYFYGSFSDTVRRILEEMNLPVKTVRRHGNKTKRYMNYGVSSDDISIEKRQIIAKVHQITKNRETDDLAQLSKDTWLFKKLDEGNTMSFAEYRKFLAEKFDIQEDQSWRNQLENSPNDLSQLTFFDENAPLPGDENRLVTDGGFYKI